MNECKQDIQSYTEWILELMDEEEIMDPYRDFSSDSSYENTVNMDLDIRVEVMNGIIVHKMKVGKGHKSNPIYLIKLVDNLIKRCEMAERQDLIDKLCGMKCSLEGI